MGVSTLGVTDHAVHSREREIFFLWRTPQVGITTQRPLREEGKKRRHNLGSDNAFWRKSTRINKNWDIAE